MLVDICIDFQFCIVYFIDLVNVLKKKNNILNFSIWHVDIERLAIKEPWTAKSLSSCFDLVPKAFYMIRYCPKTLQAKGHMLMHLRIQHLYYRQISWTVVPWQVVGAEMIKRWPRRNSLADVRYGVHPAANTNFVADIGRIAELVHQGNVIRVRPPEELMLQHDRVNLEQRRIEWSSATWATGGK